MQVEPFKFTCGAHTRCVVTEMAYQRNGVGGTGFWQLGFICSEAPERPLIAFVFPMGDDEERSEYYGVIDPHDLDFKWRGDVFLPGMLAAIEARRSQVFPEYDDAVQT